jgi:signal peptidase I
MDTGKKRGPIARLTARLPEPWRSIADWTVVIVTAAVVVLVVKAYIVNPYRIPSSSMEPTFHCSELPGCLGNSNDRVLANRFVWHFTDPARGDAIVFDAPPEAADHCGQAGTYVKRLIGLPGETISASGGDVFIDGTRLDEPYLGADSRETFDFGPETLGEDEYWMLGDNRDMSCDSRRWGPVSRDRMIGPVFLTYWPLARVGFP